MYAQLEKLLHALADHACPLPAEGEHLSCSRRMYCSAMQQAIASGAAAALQTLTVCACERCTTICMSVCAVRHCNLRLRMSAQFNLVGTVSTARCGQSLYFGEPLFAFWALPVARPRHQLPNAPQWLPIPSCVYVAAAGSTRMNKGESMILCP